MLPLQINPPSDSKWTPEYPWICLYMADKSHFITFYPVGNGDCILIQFSDGATMMIDCNFRSEAEDEDTELFDVLNDLLSNKLNKKSGLPYLNAFVLTHPDQGHCRNFDSKFYLGDPAEISDSDKEDARILIGELWYSPRIFAEHNELCAEAKALKKEAKRRMKLWADNDSHKDDLGNRIRIIGYADVDALEDIPNDRISAAGDTVEELDGKKRSGYRFFIHAPFKKDIEGDNRNATSIIMQIRMDVGDKADIGKVFFGGDAEWRVWAKILEKTEDDKNLKWNLLEAPHHCSYHFFADDREDEPEDSAIQFLGNQDGHGIVVSSSKQIKANNDNPPCQKAKNRYIKELEGEAYFKCTNEGGTVAPVIFEITKSGVKIFEEEKKETDKSANIGKREHLYG